MIGQHDTPVGVAHLDEREAKKRCHCHVESGGPVGCHDSFELFGCVGLVRRRQVDVVPGDVDVTLDDLNGLALQIVHERRSEIRVAVEQSLCGTPKSRLVHRTGESHHELNDVGVDGLVGQLGMEQHAGLQRRHRPDVDERGVSAFDVVDRLLIERNEIEIGRGESTCARIVYVASQCGQRGNPQLRQLFDVLASQYTRWVCERRLQRVAIASGGGDCVDVERRRHRQILVLDIADLVVLDRQPTDTPEILGDPGAVATEVVEADLRSAVLRQYITGVCVEIPQHAVPDTVVRNSEQSLLHCLDQCPRSRSAGESVVEVDSA